VTKASTLVASICRLPLALRVRPDRSLVALLEDARRATGAAFPTEEEFAEELSNHPELIEPWVLLSEDQRVSSGWYLQRPGDNRDAWEVGYYPTSVRESYESGVAAAAAFIARYIGAVAIR
jgi:hypothetical protein